VFSTNSLFNMAKPSTELSAEKKPPKDDSDSANEEDEHEEDKGGEEPANSSPDVKATASSSTNENRLFRTDAIESLKYLKTPDNFETFKEVDISTNLSIEKSTASIYHVVSR
jgi:hypothetical protein